MTRKLIGMVGFAGSGKDTVANIIETEYEYDRISFAKALKDVLSAMFGWDRDLIEGATKESRLWREQPDIWWETKLDWDRNPLRVSKGRFTPRVAMQLVGTNLLREKFCDALWILRVQRFIETSVNDVIVTDCRFPNEIKMIRESGGKIIRVRRGADPSWIHIARDAMNSLSPTSEASFKKMLETDLHCSEWSWVNEEFDFILENDGSLEDLIKKTKDIMSCC